MMTWASKENYVTYSEQQMGNKKLDEMADMRKAVCRGEHGIIYQCLWNDTTQPGRHLISIKPSTLYVHSVLNRI